MKPVNIKTGGKLATGAWHILEIIQMKLKLNKARNYPCK